MKSFILRLFLLLFAFTAAISVSAQRHTDNLDRGLVVMPARTSGIFLSWRILGEEYYDVTYNVYRDGSKIAEGLKVSNYVDASGSTSSTYQVAAVVRDAEQEKCDAVSSWTLQDNTNKTTNAYYKTVPVQPITDRTGADASSHYKLNDICPADLDGDGQMEFIIKRPCDDAYDKNQSVRFHVVDCYKLDGTRLWWIDMGPNMQAAADEQWDVVAFDWDQDGKAEILFRGADGVIIHHKDGTTTSIGSMTADYRDTKANYDKTGQPYIFDGDEYLIYADGATGKPYNGYPIPYPIARGPESDWTPSGILGHRSSKHLFAAPYLDGRNPSIVLARGIYTRTVMKAFDVNPTTHQLTERWHWQNTKEGSPWYGQGYHNYNIADVDMDGRDEIVYGSMVIDDNGNGLSTTGLGHGDAQHCADHDPFRWGLEQFCCNEDEPAMNYRNATTSELYYRHTAAEDDGRGLMANFTNLYPGSVGRSTTTGMISSVADKAITELEEGFLPAGDLNFRLFWDGDLCSEQLSGTGAKDNGSWVKIYKPVAPSSQSRIATLEGPTTNGTKNNACLVGDILGDWRDEIITRNSGNNELRIYSTNYPTSYGIYTLWHDHQYRNAMEWQCFGYNQPPHLSYFLGELEDFTIAPPPLTTAGRTEIPNGGTISNDNSKHYLFCPSAGGNSSVNIADGANPYIVTFNIPSLVQGQTPSDYSSSLAFSKAKFSCNVTGGALAGNTRVVKQGEGTLNLPAVDMAYTGPTDVWGGTIVANGNLTGTDITLHPHTTFIANGSTYNNVTARYNGRFVVAGENNVGTVSINSLNLKYGGTLELDYINGQFDKMNIGTFTTEAKAWSYGPKYSKSLIRINGNVPAGTYTLGTVGNLNGSINDIEIEMNCDNIGSLSLNGSQLVLTVGQGGYSTAVSTTTTDGWIVENASVIGDNVKFQHDTWAKSANGMDADATYLEYWVYKTSNLPNNSIYQTLTNLSEGYYVVEMETAINQEGTSVAPQTGVWLFANDGQTSLCTGTSKSRYNGPVGIHKAAGYVGADGILRFGIKVEDALVNWVTFRNVSVRKLTNKETLEIIINNAQGDLKSHASETGNNPFQLSETLAHELTLVLNKYGKMLTQDYVSPEELITAKRNIDKAVEAYLTTRNTVVEGQSYYVSIANHNNNYADSELYIKFNNSTSAGNTVLSSKNEASQVLFAKMGDNYYIINPANGNHYATIKDDNSGWGHYNIKETSIESNSDQWSIELQEDGKTVRFGNQGGKSNYYKNQGWHLGVITSINTGGLVAPYKASGNYPVCDRWYLHVVPTTLSETAKAYNTAYQTAMELSASEYSPSIASVLDEYAYETAAEAMANGIQEYQLTDPTTLINNAITMAQNDDKATLFMTNGDFSNAATGWTVYNPTSQYLSTKNANDDASTKTLDVYSNQFMETKVYQKIANLPNGTYKVSADLLTWDKETLIANKGNDKGYSWIGIFAESGENKSRGDNIECKGWTFVNYSTYVDVVDHTLTFGVRGDGARFYQVKNFDIQMVNAAENRANVAEGYIFSAMASQAHDALEYDLTDGKYAAASGVDLHTGGFVQQPNALIKAAREGQIAADKNVIVNGQCQNLVLTDKAGFSNSALFTAARASYERAMTNKWGTLMLPYEVVSDEHVQYFTLASVNSGSMTFVPADRLPAGTPGVFIKKDDNEAGIGINVSTVSVIQANGGKLDTAATGWELIGTYTKRDFTPDEIRDNNLYYIANDRFWKSNATDAKPLSVAPFRAYFKETTGGNHAPSFRLVIDESGEATTVKLVPESYRDAKVYTLSGVRLNSTVNLKPGIYIINGKKVVVR